MIRIITDAKDIQDNYIYLMGFNTRPITGLMKCHSLYNDINNGYTSLKVDEVLFSEIQFTSNWLAGFHIIDMKDKRYILFNASNDIEAFEFYIESYQEHIDKKSDELNMLKRFLKKAKETNKQNGSKNRIFSVDNLIRLVTGFRNRNNI